MRLSEYLQYVHALSWVEWSNGVVALTAATIAGHAIFRSIDSRTSRAMRCGYVTLAAGLLGQGASIFWQNTWQYGLDALLFGGSLALFLGSRRHAQMMTEATAGHMSIVAMLYSWAVFFLSIN